MNILRLIVAEFIGMFIDDEFLAIAVLVVVGIAAALAYVLHATALIVGTVLLLGCIAVLVASAVRGIRRG